MIMKMPSCNESFTYFPNDSGDEYEDTDDYYVEEQESFEEYEWMMNEEEFEKQVSFTKKCITLKKIQNF